MSESRARTLVLDWGRHSVHTPALLQHTRMGMFPHQLSCPGPAAVHWPSLTSAGDRLSLLIQQAGGLHAWLNMQDRPLVAVCRDQQPTLGNDKGVSVEGTVGRWRVDMDQLGRLVDRLRPDVLLAPSDECAALPESASYSRARKAVHRTCKWLEQLMQAAPNQVLLFAALEGGLEENLRKECAEAVAKHAHTNRIAGLWLSGLGLGEDANTRRKLALASLSSPSLSHLPVMVQGVSSMRELADWIDLGVDLFDSAYALHCSELGCALDCGSMDKINYRDARWRLDGSAGLSEGCGCTCCAGGYKKAYVHHLLNTNEMLGKMLLQEHNVWALDSWMRGARAAIGRGASDWARYRHGTCPK
jgi:queuine tRNA-ribosyltransferase